ncbi:hypothetical protein TFLX_00368 [Thermoflexales bacterium]|nr:hypothetical protein TFLX_00368 [Thermoflexales bacterium]
MFRKPLFLGLLIAAAVLAGAVWFDIQDHARLPASTSQHETIVLGQDRFVPGSHAALRVIVRDSLTAQPLPSATIHISLHSSDRQLKLPLYDGHTDRTGSAAVAFQVPAEATAGQQLVIETISAAGIDRFEQPIKIERDYRILLTTDKPLYQPGQIIHLRLLALNAFDRKPAAGQPIDVTIADGKGNKVFHQALTTSDFGVAFADFQLADQVNTGNYQITAQLGNASAEKTVEVKYYVLPKFAITWSADRTFYQPGQHVHGTVSANYFFGKPVSDGTVTLEGSTFDVERQVTFSLQGQTDANGNFEFEFDLPSSLAGSDLDQGLARFYVQATIIDQAQHRETANTSLAVSANPIVIRAIPESGQFRSGVENILYVLTSTPDGMPIATDLNLVINHPPQTFAVHTDQYGLAEVHLTPSDPRLSLSIQAKATNGATTTQNFSFDGDPAVTILLRPDRPVYRVGDGMQLSIFTAQAQGTAYLDLIREGQTLSTRAVQLHEGRGEVVIDLTPDHAGTLELHAYQVQPDGQIIRDTRTVLIDTISDLDIALRTDREMYRPGDQAQLNVAIKDAQGAGVPAALGLAIVDEAVFALAEQDPGFAKLYFLLEQELLQPKYELHDFSPARTLRGDSTPSTAQQIAARASLAQSAPQGDFSLAANTHAAAQQRSEEQLRPVREQQSAYFGRLNGWLYFAWTMLSWLILGLTMHTLDRRQTLNAAFGLSMLLIVGACGLVFSLREHWEIVLIVVIALGLLGLSAAAWRRKDRELQWTVVALLVYVLIGGLIVAIGSYPHDHFNNSLKVFGFLGVVLVALAYFMLLADAFGGKAFKGSFTTLLTLLLALLVGCAPAVPAPTQAPAPQPTAAPAEQKPTEPQMISDKAGSGAAEPRLRQYFPETMLWLPDAVTDQNGQIQIAVPIADSITTWRMTALASSRDGRLGSTTRGLRVFQDFFIDLDLPVALTVGDEIAVPVGVFNYLTERQTVRLEVAPADWFELLDEPIKSIDIASNEVSVVYFRLRAKAQGLLPFKVSAYGPSMSDALQKMVRVEPNGKAFATTQSDRLTANTTLKRTVNIPARAIPGASTIAVKIYPGVLSQIVEGLDSILRLPDGCFEQTSSTTYPNVLVLDYLRETQQAVPDVQLKAEQYINTGYQRLTTFEVPGGGFSLWGQVPPDRMLTAYGLQEFADMRRVHAIDEALVQRAAEWLLSQQTPDGSWHNDQGLVHEDTWRNLQNNQLPVTAYIVWSLIDAGFGSDTRTQTGLAYVRDHRGEAHDPYVVALVANALVAADRVASDERAAPALDPLTEEVLGRLVEMSEKRGESVTWSSKIATFMGSQGNTGSIETTALATLALLRANVHTEVANAGLLWLVQNKDPQGTWHTTQATVLALKALLQSIRAGSESIDAAITIKLDAGTAHTLHVTPENFDVVQIVLFDDLTPERAHTIELTSAGKGTVMYQIASNYYLPWSAVPRGSDRSEALSIDVQYDRTQLQLSDSVNVSVTVRLNDPNEQVASTLIDLGVPPGFIVQSEDLDRWVAHYRDLPQDYAGVRLERYELTGRQVIVYVSNLSGAGPLNFNYHLKAKYPLSVQTPASTAYDYYNPDQAGEVRPRVLTVTE